MKLRFSLFFFSFLLCQGLFAQADFRSIMSTYNNPDTSRGLIFIDKQAMILRLYNSDGTLLRYIPMACGRNLGQKERSGDFKTPEGIFKVQQIQPATSWGHDFKDGKGYIKNCYGNWFIRLKTGFNGIGIHGTHDPASIRTRATEGCIRLKNSDLNELQPLVKVGMTVIISPDKD